MTTRGNTIYITCILLYKIIDAQQTALSASLSIHL